jgi:hypothetical protein
MFQPKAVFIFIVASVVPEEIKDFPSLDKSFYSYELTISGVNAVGGLDTPGKKRYTAFSIKVSSACDHNCAWLT